MQGGVPEGESYENFGKRCQTQEYMRLGLLLSQNQRKGTRGITELLSLEAIHAFEDRKARARGRRRDWNKASGTHDYDAGGSTGDRYCPSFLEHGNLTAG